MMLFLVIQSKYVIHESEDFSSSLCTILCVLLDVSGLSVAVAARTYTACACVTVCAQIPPPPLPSSPLHDFLLEPREAISGRRLRLLVHESQRANQ